MTPTPPVDAPPVDVRPHPGENHEFQTTCLRCGERGFLHVALVTDLEVVRIEDRAALSALAGDTAVRP